MRTLLKAAMLWSALPLAALAQDLTPAPAEPPAPKEGQSGVQPQPEITIIRRGNEVMEEYRIAGQLYMIKVTPSKGAPYYLIDTDGDGRLETQRSQLSQDLLIPNWVILRWK